MSTSSLLHSLFTYKAWANEEFFAELAKVDPVAHQAERHTAIRLLNHIYVVDRIFAAHLSGEAHTYAGTNTPETPTFEDLRAAVAESDRWYIEYVGRLPAERLPESLPFTFTDGARGNARAHCHAWRLSSRCGRSHYGAGVGGTAERYLHRLPPQIRTAAPRANLSLPPELIGHVGLSPLRGDVEVGFAVEQKFQGKGFATEAIKAMSEWGMQCFGLPHVLGIAASENTASCKALERAGFALVDESMRSLHGKIRRVITYRKSVPVAPVGIQVLTAC